MPVLAELLPVTEALRVIESSGEARESTKLIPQSAREGWDSRGGQHYLCGTARTGTAGRAYRADNHAHLFGLLPIPVQKLLVL